MEGLITAQMREIDLMSRAFVNLKKKSGQSRGTINAHLEGLEAKWSNIEARQQVILDTQCNDDTKLNYFKEDVFGEAKLTYYGEKGKFLDALHALDPPPQCSPNVSTGTSPTLNETKKSTRKLPAIHISPFSGKYSDWPSFKDYFTALVAQDPELDKVEKLHYLEAFLSGDAANLIKNVPVTTENYDLAWQKLVAYYDDKRNLLKSCLDAFLQIKPLASESAHQLKGLRDGTNEAVETLEGLKRFSSSTCDLLVHLTLQRFNAVTRRDWELSLSEGPEFITWAVVNEFLKSRIQALERAEPAAKLSGNLTNQKAPAGGGFKKPSCGITAHSVSKSKSFKCTYCQQDHFITSCTNFRDCSTSDRYNFVVEKQLCFNCLGPHRFKDCRSSKTCFTCHGRHHTLLHRPRETLPQEPNIARSPVDTTPNSATPSGVSVHTIKATTSQPRCILLATARIKLRSIANRYSSVKALIDPCSEASFISEGLAQLLRLPRKSVCVLVTGVGAAPCHTARSLVDVTISPWFESNKS